MSYILIGSFSREEGSILDGGKLNFEVTSHARDAAHGVTMAL
jgi:hypothetical protein